jgi:hypothetical protein
VIALLALAAFPAQANERLFATTIRRPGVDLRVQELVRNRSSSTVQTSQRVLHSKPARAALVQALRKLAQERGARYFRMEKPYGGTMSGELRLVHFYRYPAVFSLRRLYSASGPADW